MDTLPASEGAPALPWAPLIDVSALPIADLVNGSDTALSRSLRQVIDSLDDPNGVISAFQSFAPR